MDPDEQISAVRAFNRFYTRKLGFLDQQLLKSPFSLSEARVLYELATRENLSAKEVGIELGLDPGYLSLTEKGLQAFANLSRTSHDDVANMLAALPPGDIRRLIEAMTAIERLLGE